MKRTSNEQEIDDYISDTEMVDDDIQIQDTPQVEEEEIEIRKPDYDVKAKGIPEFEQSILQPHFATMMVGRPNSGKSHLIYEYLTNPQLYYRKFHRVLFVTPNTKVGGLKKEDMEYHNPKFDLKWIHQQIENFNNDVKLKYPDDQAFAARYGQQRDPLNVLLLLDDCIAEIKKFQYDEKLKQLFYNRRWMINKGCLSVLMTAQYYYDLPKSLRSNLSSCIIFNCTPKDWKTIQEETLYQQGTLPRSQQEKVSQVFAQDNAFIYIDIEKSKLYHGFKEAITEKKEQQKGETLQKYRKLNK